VWTAPDLCVSGIMRKQFFETKTDQKTK